MTPHSDVQTLSLLNRLTRDHRRFARLADLLAGLLDRFHAGGEPDFDLMCELLEYVVDYSDQVHHPAEELIFAKLHERADAAVTAPLAELTEQHRQLAEANRRFRDSLEGIVHESVIAREEVEQQGRNLIERLREHIAREEAEAFAVARASLTAGDWADLETRAPSAADPVFGQADPQRFRTLYDYLKGDLAHAADMDSTVS